MSNLAFYCLKFHSLKMCQQRQGQKKARTYGQILKCGFESIELNHLFQIVRINYRADYAFK